jgi:putative ABC transport system ATP-binding protein
VRRSHGGPRLLGTRARGRRKCRTGAVLRHRSRWLLRRRLPQLTAPPLVLLRDVRKAYDDGATRHDVLEGVDLDIRAGELVALLGPSGSGKSTLLNLIAGIDAPDAGTVHVAGEDLAALDERGRSLLRRREVGFVFQFFNLVPTLTVAENVMLPLELTGRQAAARAAAATLLQKVGITGRDDSFPDELSGGEQQRVAIARALAHGPRIVLADEPTGNLDQATGARVLDLLTGLVAEQGAAMLIATHATEVVARAHRVLELRDGRVLPG